LTSECQSVQDTRRGEEEGVSSRESGSEYASVDDMRKDFDTRVVESDNVGRLGSGTGGLEEVLVVVGNEHAGNEYTDEVEEYDTVEHTFDGFGNVPARVNSF